MVFKIEKADKNTRSAYLTQLNNLNIQYSENTPIYLLLFDDGNKKISGIFYKSLDNFYKLNNYNTFNDKKQFVGSKLSNTNLNWKTLRAVRTFVDNINKRNYLYINKKVKDVGDLTKLMLSLYQHDTHNFKIDLSEVTNLEEHKSIIEQLKAYKFSEDDFSLKSDFQMYCKGVKYDVEIKYMSSDWTIPVDPTRNQSNRLVKITQSIIDLEK